MVREAAKMAARIRVALLEARGGWRGDSSRRTDSSSSAGQRGSGPEAVDPVKSACLHVARRPLTLHRGSSVSRSYTLLADKRVYGEGGGGRKGQMRRAASHTRSLAACVCVCLSLCCCTCFAAATVRCSQSLPLSLSRCSSLGGDICLRSSPPLLLSPPDSLAHSLTRSLTLTLSRPRSLLSASAPVPCHRMPAPDREPVSPTVTKGCCDEEETG